MRGLRTQEAEKFERFFSIVQKKAADSNAVFFLDCGDGHELFTDELEGEDLCGWLVPEKTADEFEKDWKAFKTDQNGKWDRFYKLANWKEKSGDIIIMFE